MKGAENQIFFQTVYTYRKAKIKFDFVQIANS
jgi:hypothetical protein